MNHACNVLCGIRSIPRVSTSGPGAGLHINNLIMQTIIMPADNCLGFCFQILVSLLQLARASPSYATSSKLVYYWGSSVLDKIIKETRPGAATKGYFGR